MRAWLIPYSAPERKGLVAHLIDTSPWLSERLCMPKRIVNSRLAAEPGPRTRKCAVCRRIAAGGAP